MNQRQRDYALIRITDLAKGKINEITKKHTTAAVSLSFDEKVALIRKGKVSLKQKDFYSSVYLSDAFDFSKHEKDAEINKKIVNPIIAKIANAEKKAKDSVMLADGTDALTAIQDFEKFIDSIAA